MANRPPLATLAQLIADRIGYTPPTAESARAEGMLAAASELIRDEAELTWLNDDGDAVVDVPYRIEQICLDVAFRAFDNSQAYTQRSLGDSYKAYDRAGREGGEAVYLTDAERRAVVRAAGGSSIAVGTMVTPFSGDTVSNFYASLGTV